ncbi:MAG TPA: hypothetical protein DDW49_02570 [Deltaproteobacteria bacterium]|nr:hypothetical protein [Deltaproteobacteria bacterium]
MNKKRSPILIFLLVSILIHLLGTLLFTSLSQNWFARNLPEPKPLMIQLNKSILPQNVVDMAKPQQEKIPEKASAESLYNQSVSQETVARPTPEAQISQPASPSQQGKPTPKEYQESKEEKQVAKTETPSPFNEYSKKPLPPPTGTLQPRSTINQGSNNEEFLPDYKVGGKTYLNTLANPNLAYYVELKRKFRMAWNPIPVLRPQINRITAGQVELVLGVSINGRGELANLIVIQSSGIPSYDEEGKRTVTASSPFTTPPTSILGEDGMMHMAWHFTVYL